MEPVKIQINSLKALERLIGNDPEFEFEIRRSVIAHFFNKSNHFTEKISQELENEVIEVVFQKKPGTSWRTEYELKEEYLSIINKAAQEAIDSVVWPKINELLDIPAIQKRIDDLINQQVTHIVNVWTSGQIQAAIDKGVRDVLTQQLNLIQKAKGE